jgi:DNA-binding transcriptional LysR family regulator
MVKLMDYNKLKTFTVVVELNSFTQAARELRRSQSAISQQIQSLEEELNVRLLERKGRKIYLSKEGKQFYEQAKITFGRLDDEASRIQGIYTSVRGHIRLGVLNACSNDIPLASTLRRFCLNYPEVSLEIIEGSDAKIEAALVANEIDLGIMVHFESSKLFHKHSLNISSHYIVGSREFLKSHPIENPRDLLNAPLIDLNETFACFGTWFKINALNLLPSLKHSKPKLIVPNHRTALEIVSEGFGLALVPEYLLKNQTKIVKIFSDAKAVRTGLDIALRTGRTPTLAETAFIETIKNSR